MCTTVENVHIATSFSEDIFALLNAEICRIDLDITHHKMHRRFGFLSVSMISGEDLSVNASNAQKRPQKSNAQPVKPKMPKNSAIVQPLKTSQSLVKSPSNEMQIQPSFQQDPNDLIATTQSLDSGEILFSCKLCGLQAKWRTNVRRHIVLKHMQGLKESFKCTVCEKEFSLKHHLKGHYINSHNMNEKLAKAALSC